MDCRYAISGCRHGRDHFDLPRGGGVGGAGDPGDETLVGFLLLSIAEKVVEEESQLLTSNSSAFVPGVTRHTQASCCSDYYCAKGRAEVLACCHAGIASSVYL
jgi:hypothetical protein